MASDTANKVAGSLTNNSVSTTTAGGGAPVAAGTGASTMGQEAKDILTREGALDARKGGATGLAMTPYMQQVAQGEAQKGITGLSFAHTLGDVRNRIAQDRMDSREKEAQSGFIGSGAQARNQVEENRKISNTLDTQEADYTNKLRNLNATIGSARQSELNIGQPLIAKGIARKVATDNSLYGFKSDEGIWGKFAGSFGKEQTTHAELDKTAFQQNKAMQSLVSQFGIDINGADFDKQVSDALAKTLTTKMSSVYDPTIEIKFDDGTGSKTIDTKTRSLSSQILGDILGVVNVAGIGAAVLTAGTSMMAAASAEAIDAIASVGSAVGGALEGMDATLEAAGLSLDLTASEAVGAGFGGVIEQAAGELGVNLGEGVTGETLGQGFAESLEQTVGEEVYSAASSETTMNALGIAKQTFVEAIGRGASVEEATQAAMLSGQDILANTEVMNGMAEATAGAGEAGAGAGAGEAGVAQTGAGVQEAGVGVPAGEAGVPTTPTGAPEPVTPEPVTPEPTEPVVPDAEVKAPGKLQKLGQGIKTGANKAANAVKNTASSVGKTSFKLALKSGGKILGTSIGQVYGVSTAIANSVAGKLEGFKGTELSPRTMDTIIKELIEQESKGN